MAKRFTDTDLWDKEWFMSLSCKHKCLVRFIFDKCDQAGVWSANWALASAYIGDRVTHDDLSALSGRIEQIGANKYFIPDFIEFQYGQLTESCRPHKKIISLLQKHGLYDRVLKGYPKGIDTLEEKDTYKEEEKEEGGMGETQPPSEGSDFTSELSIVQQELQTQTIWLDQVAMQRGLKNTQEARMWLDKFFGELRIRGDTVKSLHDTKSHFVSWLKIQLDKQKPQKNGKYIPTRISGSDFD